MKAKYCHREVSVLSVFHRVFCFEIDGNKPQKFMIVSYGMTATETLVLESWPSRTSAITLAITTGRTRILQTWRQDDTQEGYDGVRMEFDFRLCLYDLVDPDTEKPLFSVELYRVDYKQPKPAAP